MPSYVYLEVQVIAVWKVEVPSNNIDVGQLGCDL
jgi:hypothetical protein